MHTDLCYGQEMCPLTFTYPKIKQILTNQTDSYSKKHSIKETHSLLHAPDQLTSPLSYHCCLRGLGKYRKISKVSQLLLFVRLILWGISISLPAWKAKHNCWKPKALKPKSLADHSARSQLGHLLIVFQKPPSLVLLIWPADPQMGRSQSLESWTNIRWKLNIFDMSRHNWNI